MIGIWFLQISIKIHFSLIRSIPPLYHPFNRTPTPTPSPFLPTLSPHSPPFSLMHFLARLSSLNPSPQLARHSCPTFNPTKPLLSNYQLSPHYFKTYSLFHPSLLAHFLPSLSPLSITQLLTLLHISRPSYPRLSNHSYIKFFLLSQPFLTPLYYLTPIPVSNSSHPILSSNFSTHSPTPLSHFTITIHTTNVQYFEFKKNTPQKTK